MSKSTSNRISILLLVACCILGTTITACAQQGTGLPVPGMPVPEELREALLKNSTEPALELLDRLEQEMQSRRDDWLFYRSVILERANRFEEANEALKALESAFPDSHWFHKGRLRRSQILMRLNRYGEAQKILEQETTRLRSGDRIEELAVILLEVADRISAKPDPNLPDPPAPQYQRAFNLYNQAADLMPPRATLEKALWGLNRCASNMNIHNNQKIEVADRYLALFDPQISGESAGKNVFKVMLNRSRARSGVMARRGFQKLIATIDSCIAGEEPWKDQFKDDSDGSLAAIRGDALLNIAGTFSTLDLGIAALRRFVTDAPGHPQRIRTQFRIGELLRENRQSEAALEHWKHFISESIDGDQALLAELKRTAQFNVATLLQQMNRLPEARTAFLEYLRRAPDGPDGSAAQTAIITIDSDIGSRFLDDSRWSEARAAIQSFAQQYPLDNRTRSLLYRSAVSYSTEATGILDGRMLEELEDTEAVTVRGLFQTSIDQLKKLSGKYPNSYEGFDARLQIGIILEKQLLQLEESILAYKACFGTPAEGEARKYLGELTEKSLKIETTGLIRSDQPAAFSLDTRNIEKVEVRIYPLDIESYFRKYYTRNDVEQLDLDLIDPWKSIEVEVDNYSKYRPCHQMVELPVEGSGTWAVMVLSEKLQSTTLVVRSDIDVIVKAGRREVLIYAQDMLLGKPAEGVDVLLAIENYNDAQPRENLRLQEVVTGSDGTVRVRYDKQDLNDDVRVLALRGGDSAVTGLDLSSTLFPSGRTARVNFLTDRATYRPGDTVHWRAVVREVDPKTGLWYSPAGEQGRVSVLTPGGIDVARSTATFREAGTLSDSFVLPIDAPHGNWTIQLSGPDAASGRQSFLVENFAPLPVDLSIESEKLVLVRGEVVEATISASTWYGEPLAGTDVLVTFNDGHSETFTLDASGKAVIKQDTRDETGSRITFHAIIQEYGVQASTTVTLADSMWQMSLKLPRSSGDYIVGETVPVVITATDAAGQPVERDIKVRLVETIRTGGRWVENTIESRELQTSSEGKGEVRLPLDDSGRFMIVAEGVDRIGNRIASNTSNLTVSGEDEERGLIWLVERTRVDVGESIELDVQNTRPDSPALLTIIGDGIQHYRIIGLEEGKNAVSLDVAMEMYPEATVTLSMMDKATLHEADVLLRVRKHLQLEVISPSEPVIPGSEVKLQVITRNLQGEPIPAEVALAVVDVSVDDLHPGWFRDLVAADGQRQPASGVVKTATSCGFRYQAITEQIEQTLLDEDALGELALLRESQRMIVGQTLSAMPSPPQAGMHHYSLGSDVSLEESDLEMADERSFDGNGISGGGGGAFGFRNGRGGLSAKGGASTRRNRKGKSREAGDSSSGISFEAFTAHWEGDLITDENGKATVTFIAPERSTTWRIRAQAIGSDDLFGNETSSFIARDEISVDPILPSSTMEGDQIEPRIRIANSSGIRGKGTLTVRLGGGDGAMEVSSDLVLLDGLQEVTLEMVGPLPEHPALPIEIILEVGEGEDSRTIRQVRTIAVRPWGLQAIGTSGGSLDSSVTRKVRLPQPNNDETSEWLDRTLQIWIGSSLDQVLIDLAAGDSPGHQRHSIHPDLATRAANLRGALAVLNKANKVQVEIPAEKGERIRLRIEGLIGELSMIQNRDGGWGWVGGSSISQVSSSVMIALSRANQSGFSVPARVLQKGIQFLEKNFRSTQSSRDDIKVQLLYALACSNSGDFGTANRLHRSRTKLSSASLSYLTGALIQMKRLPMARDVARTLLDRRESDGSWSGEHADRKEHNWNRFDLVITAMALHACSEAGISAAELQSSVQWLEDHRPWHHGRGAGLALEALATVQGESVPAATDCEVEVFIDGEPRLLMMVNPNQPSSHETIELGDGPGVVEIRLESSGKGNPNWAALLSGRSEGYPAVTDDQLIPRENRYLRSQPRLDGKQINIGFSSLGKKLPDPGIWYNDVTQLPLGESTRVSLQVKPAPKGIAHEYYKLDLVIPAGMSMVEGSLRGHFDNQHLDGNLLTLWTRSRNAFNIDYSLVGTVPGQYRIPPPILRSVSDPSQISLGSERTITVLSRGLVSEDDYRPTPDEVFNRAQIHWQAKRWRPARQLLTGLWDEFKDYLRDDRKIEVARILLLSAIEAGDNASMVSFFEVLKEQAPDLNIEFENVIRIGEAYRILGEHQRSIQIFLAVMQETFGRDLQVAGVLEQRNQKASLMLLLRLVMEYPDLPPVLAAEQTLTDQALSLSSQASARNLAISPAQLSIFGIQILRQFLYIHGDDPTASDAGLNLVSAFLDLQDWQSAAEVSGILAEVFRDSQHLDSFRYTRAVALWSLNQQDEALELLQKIADAQYSTPAGGTRPSENRELALYIIGQIHHAANRTTDAKKYYEEVSDLFEDAAASLARFRARELQLDEISEFRPGETVEIELRYRNIEEAEILAYKVNLMTLALREQDLSRVTEVNLSGISPTVRSTVELGKIGAGGGAMKVDQMVTLPIDELGAYLIIVRGNDVHTSGLVLINQMELVVEDNQGSLRIQSIDPVIDTLIPDVQVRVLDQGAIQSGSTDRRGLYISESRGTSATVIARRGTSDYAFFRGTSPTGQVDITPDATGAGQFGSEFKNLEVRDYLQNVIQSNFDNRGSRSGAWKNELKKVRTGVQIKQASD